MRQFQKPTEKRGYGADTYPLNRSRHGGTPDSIEFVRKCIIGFLKCLLCFFWQMCRNPDAEAGTVVVICGKSIVITQTLGAFSGQSYGQFRKHLREGML